MKALIAAALALASFQAFAGQPTSCDDASVVADQVVAKAESQLSSNFPKPYGKSTNAQNVEDDSVNGGEVWTVNITGLTGHAALKIHVTVDDGGCKVD